MIQITQRQFLAYGFLVFLLVGIANIFTNAYSWNNLYWSAKISAVFMNLFNFLVALFFYSMLKQLPKEILKPIEEEELDKIVEELKKQ